MVVIGGGLGGLAAAVEAARLGREVVLCEAQPHVGGYATCFRRGDFRFEASLHLLDGVEPGGSNAAVWEALGLRERIALVRPEEMRREVWPAHDLEVPHGLDAWIDALATHFPDEADGLARLSELCVQAQSAYVRDRDARLAGEVLPPMRGLASLLDATAGEVIERHLRDPQAQAMFSALSGYLGLGPAELAAVPFLSMIASYQRDGGTFPIGGGQAITDALAEQLRAHGGKIWTDCPATGVETARGRVSAVHTPRGRIPTRDVVCAIAPTLFYENLLDCGPPRRLARRLERLTLGTSVVKLWLGLDRDLPDLPYEVFLRGAYTLRIEAGDPQHMTLVLQHRVDPTCCPPGQGVASLTVAVEAEPEEWTVERSQALAEAMLSRARIELGVDLNAHAVARSLSRPATFAHYAGHPGGTIHGSRAIPSQSGPRRLPIASPVGGLHHAGAWTYGGSGYLPSLTSGLIAGRTLCGAPS